MPAIIAAAETLCGLRLRQRLSIHRLLQAVAGSGWRWPAITSDGRCRRRPRAARATDNLGGVVLPAGVA